MKQLYSNFWLLLILTGCTSANIVSNKSPDFENTSNKVFFEIESSLKMTSFYKNFMNELNLLLTLNDVESTYSINENSSDKIFKYEPSVVIKIRQTSSSRNSDHFIENPGATFDLQLFKPQGENMLWRSTLTLNSYSNINQAAKTGAKTLMNKMIDDNIIQKKNANSQQSLKASYL